MGTRQNRNKDLSVTTRKRVAREKNQREKSEGNTDNTRGNCEARDPTKEKYNKGHIVIPYMQD